MRNFTLKLSKSYNFEIKIDKINDPLLNDLIGQTAAEKLNEEVKIINEVYAYAEFREVRAIILNEGRHPTGLDLAPTLTKYASRSNYTDLIAELIKYNIRGVYEL